MHLLKASVALGALLAASAAHAGSLPTPLLANGRSCFSPLAYDPNGGSGGDDAASLQAAVNAAISAGGGYVCIPAASSGAWNVCAAPISLVTTTVGAPIHFVGPGEGLSPVRIKPGCVSPPNEVFYVNNGSGDSDKTRARVSFDGLRIDAYGLAKFGVYIQNATDWSMDNTVVRNSKGGSGNANVYAAGGSGWFIGKNTRFENLNDYPHVIYNTSADLPDYGFATRGTDGTYAGQALNAKIATVAQLAGGANTYLPPHPWSWNGASSGVPGAIDYRSQYSFYLVGSATVIGAVADTFTTAGIYAVPVAAGWNFDVGGVTLIGNRCEQQISNTAPCIELDNSQGGAFTGSIAGTTLTVPGSISGAGIWPGQYLYVGGSVVAQIVNQLTSTTWQVSVSQTVASTAMTTTSPMFGAYIVGNQVAGGATPIKIDGTLPAGSIVQQNPGADDVQTGTPWQSYTATVGCGSGTLTTYTASVRYHAVNKQISYEASITDTTNGTCAGLLQFVLPYAAMANSPAAVYDATSSSVLSGFVVQGAYSLNLYSATGGYPGVSGHTIVASGSYEAQ